MFICLKCEHPRKRTRHWRSFCFFTRDLWKYEENTNKKFIAAIINLDWMLHFVRHSKGQKCFPSSCRRNRVVGRSVKLSSFDSIIFICINLSITASNPVNYDWQLLAYARTMMLIIIDTAAISHRVQQLIIIYAHRGFSPLTSCFS